MTSKALRHAFQHGFVVGELPDEVLIYDLEGPPLLSSSNAKAGAYAVCGGPAPASAGPGSASSTAAVI